MSTLRATALSITLALAMGCNPENPNKDYSYDSTVQGRVDDGAGQQSRSLGGSGTVEAASTVTLSTVNEDGSLTLISEAEVDSSGSYSLDAPSGEDRMVLEALNAEGEVIASAILEATAEGEGGVVTATPMDTESSVEASTFLEIIASGASKDDVNVIDLRGRIDSAMAAAVAESSDSEAELEALAQASWAAQVSEETAYADQGINLTQSQMFEVELAYSQSLSAALDAGENAQVAYDDFFSGVSDAHAELGASAEDQAESETQASLSMRLVLDNRLSGGSDALQEAAAVHAGELEAWTTARFTETMFTVADVEDAIQQEAEEAASDLENEAEDADSIEATIGAYAQFSASMVGQGSVLDDMLVSGVISELTFDLILDAALDAQGDFIAEVTGEVRSALSGASFSREDAEAVADAVADARAHYRAALESMGELTALSDTEAELVVDVIITADGSFVATR
ncbi:MAG: hypothetical protein H6741_01595 [Alphaproteobacteria bacterium]|nr:hypothetical protein [Alphaproteobacteria bacterium]